MEKARLARRRRSMLRRITERQRQVPRQIMNTARRSFAGGYGESRKMPLPRRASPALA